MFEDDFRRLSELLYDTSVPMERLDAEVVPYIANDVVFTDPWQQDGGIERYRLGLAGFHSMLNFTLDIKQIGVEVHGDTGRTIVDSVMHLKPLKLLPSYPLRTILTFAFRLTPEDTTAPFKIFAHEEMWSFGDMIQAVPLAGKFYERLFRRGFAYAFLGASYVSAWQKNNLPAPR